MSEFNQDNGNVDKRPPRTGPRVFHRGKGSLIILWEKPKGDDFTAAILVLKSLSDQNDSRERTIPIDAISYDGDFRKRIQNKLTDTTIVCEIDESIARMSRNEDYYVRIKQGDTIQGIRVYKAGVKRPYEGEMTEKNVHLHGWDKSRSKWRKIDGVQLPDGRFGLLTVANVAECPECGFKPEEKE